MKCPNCLKDFKRLDWHKCRFHTAADGHYYRVARQLRLQDNECFYCHRELYGRYTQLAQLDVQYLYQDEKCVCIHCSDSLREERAQYVTTN